MQRRRLFPASLLPIAMIAVLSSPGSAGGAIELVSPEEGAVLCSMTPEQKRFLDSPKAEREVVLADEDARKALRGGRNGKPLPFVLRWKDDPADAAAPHPRRSYDVEVRREPDGLRFFAGRTSHHSVKVRNLEIARKWIWTVRALEGDKVVDEASGSFFTEDRAPRQIDVPDVRNVRDLGGRTGLEGRRVKQGLVFRSIGFNNNAKDVWATREEVLAADTNGVVAAELARIDAFEASLDAMTVGETALSSPVATTLGGAWTVWQPSEGAFSASGKSAIETLAADAGGPMPGELLGAAAASVAADSDGRVVLGDSIAAIGPAILAQDFTAEADGFAVVSCGADWWWDLRVNGTTVADYVKAGNPAHPVAAGNVALVLPVRKGANRLVATVRTGADGWAFCMDPRPDVAPADATVSTIAATKARRDALFRVKKGFKPGASRISAANRPILLDTLAIRTDIDLRTDGECQGMEGSPLGPSVRWVHVSSAAYRSMQKAWGKEAFREVFRVFLDPANYPIDFHCIAGRDRTGAVAMILNALLGVEEEELRKDWQVTAFNDPTFQRTPQFEELLRGFDRYPGESINQRVEAYVLDIGFTEKDIEWLRDFLLERDGAARPWN